MSEEIESTSLLLSLRKAYLLWIGGKSIVEVSLETGFSEEYLREKFVEGV